MKSILHFKPGQKVVKFTDRQNDLSAVAYTIRPARRSDSRLIYELAMDPRIRAMSTRSEEFTFEEHERWYAEKRANRLSAIWIMEVGDIPVGQVRYGIIMPRFCRDTDEEGVYCECVDATCRCAQVTGSAEVAISIVPHEWRKGYALTLLRETMPFVRDWLKVDTLVALVLRYNRPSRRLFRRAGFRFVGAECRMGSAHARYEVEA